MLPVFLCRSVSGHSGRKHSESICLSICRKNLARSAGEADPGCRSRKSWVVTGASSLSDLAPRDAPVRELERSRVSTASDFAQRNRNWSLFGQVVTSAPKVRQAAKPAARMALVNAVWSRFHPPDDLPIVATSCVLRHRIHDAGNGRQYLVPCDWSSDSGCAWGSR